MIDLASFEGVQLRGGFIISEVRLASEPLKDALGRDAIAQTRILGRRFYLLIRAGLTEKELSVTLYHEVLEAALVGSVNPPESLAEFNEGDFEQTAYQMHENLGVASSENLNRMLQDLGFGEH
jgi:hypothetical protein